MTTQISIQQTTPTTWRVAINGVAQGNEHTQQGALKAAELLAALMEGECLPVMFAR